ncbi:MAG: DinB family protein [bacterium]|nr:DinB family protein [bacterium]
MNQMALTLQKGLEKSNLFLKFFTTGLEGPDWTRELEGFPNSALWTLGHIAYSRAYFYELLSGKKIYQDAWKSWFEYGSPHTTVEQLPPLQECWTLAQIGFDHLIDFLSNVSEEDLLSAPYIASSSFATKLDLFIHLTHHEAHHTGSLSMMRRVMGKEKLV